VGHFHFKEKNMIKVGDTLPHTTLMEYSEVEGNGCSIGPNPVDVGKAAAGKTIALFASTMHLSWAHGVASCTRQARFAC